MLKPFAIVCAISAMFTGSAWAGAAGPDLSEPPVVPPTLQDGESIEPEITIIQEEDRTIEEYRANGQLYMIKITPDIGPSYYLMDTDGDGSLETQKHNLANPEVPNWILLEW
ncbi:MULTISPECIES: DUF2782 domain-containing protein [unclassified Methylophaga]|jgi:hypothetical protein|uniref:DUF2782 domain-containing protein n=1 Tax=unclassified Methylophaga TaxID=2629249 RepID=UPI0023B5D0E8|nr:MULTISPECIES: DUF2782 domain-containing protein [unclassified Methylophaga]|tara:strand:- start:694 stop:1029 length:336 start_codon:yes stop_codon:yes gene_type:complete